MQIERTRLKASRPSHPERKLRDEARGGLTTRASTPRSLALHVPEPRTLIMATAVWGDWYIDLYLDVNLPTLLAPGNLPALARYAEITYVIFTRAADSARIDAAPQIALLRRMMDVEIRLLADGDLEDPIGTHHRCWKMATEQAERKGSFVLLLPPDTCWSENSFASVVRRLERGERAIFMTYLRAESTTFVKALLERRDAGSVGLAVPPQEMVELCVRSLHPLMAAYLRQSDYFPTHSEMMLWAVPQEGFAARIFAREMFLYNPGELNLNPAALAARPLQPGAASFITDSDELFAVSLAPLGKDIAWHLHPRKADPVDMAGWWLSYDSPANDFLVGHKVRWHFAPTTETKWRAVEFGADLFVRRAAAIRECMRLWQAARELECSTAALILATAAHTGSAARAARGRGPAIVFMPSDVAFAGPQDPLQWLLAPGNKRELVHLLRAHYMPDAGAVVSARNPLEAMLGRQQEIEVRSALGPLRLQRAPDGAIRIGSARVLKGPHRVGLHCLYVVDGLLTNAATALDR